MVDIVGGINSMNSSSAMQSLKYKSEEAKVKSFEEALQQAAGNEDDEELKKAAQEFESYFLQTMLKEMRNTVPTDGLIPRGNAEQMFQSMLDEEYSKEASKGQGMGLAKMIYEQMSRQRTGQVPPNHVPIATDDISKKISEEIENLDTDKKI